MIHETHVPDLYEVCLREGMGVALSTIAIDHLGYDGDLAHKHRRNLPLLRARLATDPGHVYSWCHLGVTLHGMGDTAGAEEAWWCAVAVVRSKHARTIADSGPYADLIRCLLARGDDAAALLAESRALFPDNFTLQWLHARSLTDTERFAEAMPLLEGLVTANPEELAGGTLAHDERIFGLFAYEALGLCCFRLGRFADSARWYGRAEECAPRPLENRTKRQLAESLIGS